MNENQVDILARAIFTYGTESQINMAIEEAGELIVALAKRGRNNNGSTVEDIIGEMADVSIMIEQLKLIFDNGKMFDKAVKSKLFRLDMRLKTP